MNIDLSWPWPSDDLELVRCPDACRIGNKLAATAPQSLYQHSRISQPGTLRILTLLPGTPSDALHCRLEQYHLEDCPKYDAISYTWGSSVRSHRVWIDDQPCEVTSNAHSALHRLRHPTDEVRYWIDSLCIDQGSDEDKSMQIDMMKDIYRCAQRVVAWLGNDVRGTAVRSFLYGLQECHVNGSGKMMPPRTNETWNAVLQFFHHSWFERAWIIQEMVMAASIVFIYGSEPMSWEAVAFGFETLCNPFAAHWDKQLTLSERRKVLREFPSDMLQMRQVKHMRDMRDIDVADLMPSSDTDKETQSDLIRSENELMPSLCELLRRCCHTKSSDPKDKVYALIALSQEAMRTRNRRLIAFSFLPVSTGVFSTDYQVPAPAIYMRCALQLLINESVPHRTPLNILPLAGVGYARNFNLLPSWVPDWSCPPESAILSFDRGDDWDYRASGCTCDHNHYNKPLHFSPEEDEKIRGGHALFGLPNKLNRQYAWRHDVPWQILLKGVQTDKIRICSDVYDPKVPEAVINPLDHLQRILSWLDHTRALAALHTPQVYWNGQTQETAYWRTLIGDKTREEERPAGADHEAYFHGFLGLLHQAVAYCRKEEERQPLRQHSSTGPSSVVDEKIPFLEELLNVLATPFPATMRKAAGDRRFAITESGYMTLVPPGTKEGDQIWILLGAQCPFVLRPSSANITTSGQTMSPADSAIRGEVMFHTANGSTSSLNKLAEQHEQPWYGDWDSFLKRTFQSIDLPLLSLLPDTIDGTGAETFQIVGECYMHGVMDGEGLGDAILDNEINPDSVMLKTIAIQ